MERVTLTCIGTHVRITSPQYDHTINCKFDRSMRVPGRVLTVPASDVTLVDTPGRARHYRVSAKNARVLAEPEPAHVGGRAEARVKDPATLRRLVALVSKLADRVTVRFDDTGMALLAMDARGVLETRVHVDPSGFDAYECDPAGVVIGVKTVALLNALKCVDAHDVLTLSHAGTSELVVRCDATGRVATHGIELVLADVRDPPPTQTCDTVVVMRSADLRRVCTDMKVIGADAIGITAHDVLTFDDGRRCHVTFQRAMDAYEEYTDGARHSRDETVRQTGRRPVPARAARAARAGGVRIEQLREQLAQRETDGRVRVTVDNMAYATSYSEMCPVVRLHVDPRLPVMVEYECEWGMIQHWIGPLMDTTRPA